ncbi:MAG TPA: hypothetical protein VK726_16765 [Acetobacteraceae bacterium]|jgi:hypothetical protein|nr:hypothetical protein [Acetobacteraceae bacterium]
MTALNTVTWTSDWAWSLPLIAITVVIHVFGLGVITGEVSRFLNRNDDRRGFASMFALIMSVTVTLATILHGIEGAVWAAAYRLLGALPENKAAMLYSISAMTSYGNSNLNLPNEWQMMGALEALNGMLLFGLSTAFLFAMIQRVWPIGIRGRDRQP